MWENLVAIKSIMSESASMDVHLDYIVAIVATKSISTLPSEFFYR